MASIRQRDWTTNTGKKRSGWEVSWYAEGRRRKKLFTGPEARIKAKRLRGQLDSAAPEERAKTGDESAADAAASVETAGKRWVRYVERELGRERSTWGKYEQHLRDHLCPAVITRPGDDEEVKFGELDVAEITAPDCEALKDHLLKKLSGDLAAKVLSTFRMLMNDVVRRGERAANPAQTVRIRQKARGEDEVEIPSLEEMRAILAAAASTPPAPATFDEAWVGLTIFSGLRPSENRGLAIEDVTVDGPTPGMAVRRRADQWNVIGPVKSASGRRFVPLGPSATVLLKRWLLVIPRGDGFDDPERPGQKLHPLFPTSTGTIQSLANIYHRMWVPLMAKAELVHWVPVVDEHNRAVLDKDGKPLRRPVPFYSVNCLRHFAASLMIDEGISPKKIQKRMGHSSIQVTYDLYGHLFDRREADSAEAARIEQKLLG